MKSFITCYLIGVRPVPKIIKSLKCYLKKGKVSFSELEHLMLRTPINDATVIAYFDYGVSIGKLKEGKWLFPEPFEISTHLLEMRLFNLDEELHIVKSSDDEYVYRHLLDKPLEGYDVVTYDHEVDYYLVNGTEIKETKSVSEQVFTTLTEDSGIVLTLPLQITSDIIQVFVEVIQYITYDNEGMMRFADARLSRFVERVRKGDGTHVYETLH
mgnify:FL=1